MSDYIWIDALEVGRRIGAPERSFIPPIPGETHMVTVQNWDGDALQRGIEYLRPWKTKGGTVVITGHVDAWIILGLGYSLMPECRVMYGAGLNGPGTPPVATPLSKLPTGQKNPKLRFDYGIRIEGENCFLDYRVDDPDAPPGVVHTFDNDDLPDLILPEIPEGKNLFLYAKACYYVQVNVAHSYTDHALSVSTAYQDADVYRCAWSINPGLKAGDAVPRTHGSEFTL